MGSLEEKVLQAKNKGLSDQEIGEKYNVNLRFIERVITKHLGINVSKPNIKKRIRNLQPKNFKLETGTVWSFRSRGNWATHNGNYRGNWSPYIPRNVIERYSELDDIILDCFCGAGTTGVECKLTHRNFIGVDINPMAIGLAKENIDFQIVKDGAGNGEKNTMIEYRVGDARKIQFISDESIDLICSHPPYADIIHYTENERRDLSFYNIDGFIKEMNKVARENYRVLKDDKYCAILIGDMRKKKHVIPLGFLVIDTYLKNGFLLKDLVVKRQHNCKTTGFWKKNSIKYNFLLLAHEYLAIFKKSQRPHSNFNKYNCKNEKESILPDVTEGGGRFTELETTTVWIFNSNSWEKEVIRNLVGRYNGGNYLVINSQDDFKILNSDQKRKSILIVNGTYGDVLKVFCNNVESISRRVEENGYIAVLCSDIRMSNGMLIPNGIDVLLNLRNCKSLRIRELVVISIENGERKASVEDDLDISHKYLLIFRVDRGE